MRWYHLFNLCLDLKVFLFIIMRICLFILSLLTHADLQPLQLPTAADTLTATDPQFLLSLVGSYTYANCYMYRPLAYIGPTDPPRIKAVYCLWDPRGSARYVLFHAPTMLSISLVNLVP